MQERSGWPLPHAAFDLSVNSASAQIVLVNWHIRESPLALLPPASSLVSSPLITNTLLSKSIQDGSIHPLGVQTDFTFRTMSFQGPSPRHIRRNRRHHQHPVSPRRPPPHRKMDHLQLARTPRQPSLAMDMDLPAWALSGCGRHQRCHHSAARGPQQRLSSSLALLPAAYPSEDVLLLSSHRVLYSAASQETRTGTWKRDLARLLAVNGVSERGH